MNVKAPTSRPCGNCPYRRDAPSGVWSEEEYDKLPAYDGETMTQPPRIFLCHQQNGHICAGWAGCHDMDHSLALRLAAARGTMSDKNVEATVEYESPVPLFTSGSEAAEHGNADIDHPGNRAQKAISKLEQRADKQTSVPS